MKVRTCPIPGANRWQSLTIALRKSKSRASGFSSQANATPNEEVKKVKMDFKRFLDLRPKPADDGKCGSQRLSDVCKWLCRPKIYLGYLATTFMDRWRYLCCYTYPPLEAIGDETFYSQMFSWSWSRSTRLALSSTSSWRTWGDWKRSCCTPSPSASCTSSGSRRASGRLFDDVVRVITFMENITIQWEGFTWVVASVTMYCPKRGHVCTRIGFRWQH